MIARHGNVRRECAQYQFADANNNTTGYQHTLVCLDISTLWCACAPAATPHTMCGDTAGMQVRWAAPGYWGAARSGIEDICTALYLSPRGGDGHDSGQFTFKLLWIQNRFVTSDDELTPNMGHLHYGNISKI
eukprot:gene9044-biopygen3390